MVSKACVALLGAMLLPAAAASPPPAADDRVRYSCAISGFAMSPAADGEQSAAAWDEIDPAQFVHIHVFTTVPDTVTTLAGRIRAVENGKPGAERPLPPGKRVGTQTFDFVIDH